MHYWRKKVLSTVLIVLSVVAFSSIAFAESGVINGDSVRVRSGSGTDYRKVDLLQKQKKVEILEYSDGWYNIKYGNNRGWVYGKYLTKIEKPRNYVVTTADRVNLRSGPDTEHEVVDCMKKGSQADIIQKSGGWYKVKNSKGKVGWVINTLVKVKSSSVSRGTPLRSKKSTTKPKKGTTKVITKKKVVTSTKTSRGQKIVNYAKKFLGVPYIYGGTNINRGVDCSGYVQYVYAKNGVKLNRVAKNQAKNGWWVSRKSLRPGDLIFFDTSNRGHINHVGIYIGNNKFIHASSAKSKHRVCISELNSFYSRSYRGARRIVE